MQSIRSFGLSAGEYVSQRAWESASLEICPYHPDGSCRLVRHGSYGRTEPPRARIARFLCLLVRRTISLLPDFLAGGFKGTLQEIEDSADEVERRGETSLEELSAVMRPMAESDPDKDHADGMVKWLRRRRRWVTVALTVALGLMPEKLAGREPTLADFRAALGVKQVLVALREALAGRLAEVPAPLGLEPRPSSRKKGRCRRPHRAGRDPPRALSLASRPPE